MGGLRGEVDGRANASILPDPFRVMKGLGHSARHAVNGLDAPWRLCPVPSSGQPGPSINFRALIRQLIYYMRTAAKTTILEAVYPVTPFPLWS
jgi:hypothetical protein